MDITEIISFILQLLTHELRHILIMAFSYREHNIHGSIQEESIAASVTHYSDFNRKDSWIT
jgi:hypothetical protein